jgi:hypothetical protein
VQDHPVYVEKYRQGMMDINITPDSMGLEYHVAVRVKPHKVRGF